jgi:hypothetical protein
MGDGAAAAGPMTSASQLQLASIVKTLCSAPLVIMQLPLPADSRRCITHVSPFCDPGHWHAHECPQLGTANLQELVRKSASGTASSRGKLAKPVTAACISKEVSEAKQVHTALTHSALGHHLGVLPVTIMHTCRCCANGACC